MMKTRRIISLLLFSSMSLLLYGSTPSIKGQLDEVRVPVYTTPKPLSPPPPPLVRKVREIVEVNAGLEWNRLLLRGRRRNSSHSSPCSEPFNPHPFPPTMDPCHKDILSSSTIPIKKKDLEKATKNLIQILDGKALQDASKWRNTFLNQAYEDYEQIHGENGELESKWKRQCKQCTLPCSSCLWCNSTKTCIEGSEYNTNRRAIILPCENPSTTCHGRR